MDAAGTPFSESGQFQDLIDTLFKENWVVYLKESFRKPDSVIEYLSRYTHRIAVSNHRILAVENDAVTFEWKDYACGNKKQEMTIGAQEFIRRFLLHVVPPRYVRIRYYGIMATVTTAKTGIFAVSFTRWKRRGDSGRIVGSYPGKGDRAGSPDLSSLS